MEDEQYYISGRSPYCCSRCTLFLLCTLQFHFLAILRQIGDTSQSSIHSVCEMLVKGLREERANNRKSTKCQTGKEHRPVGSNISVLNLENILGHSLSWDARDAAD